MKKLKVIELFGGIGACTQALINLEIPHEVVDYVEIDKYAVKSYNAMNGTSYEPQDISEWDKDIEVDLIMHGSPCQDFSIAGNNKGAVEGGDTRSSLMYETVRIVNKLRPRYVIWENVKNVLSKKHKHNFDNYLDQMKELGYTNHYQVLNAKHYGVPQNRERVFVVSILSDDAFAFPEPIQLDKVVLDILEDEVDDKYYVTNEKANKLTHELLSSGEIHKLGNKSPIDYTINQPRKREVSNCITARYDAGIQTQKQISLGVVEKIEINQVGNMVETGNFDNPQRGRVYHPTGICPTIDTMQGGGLEPKFMECLPVITPDRLEKRQNGRRFKEDGDPMFTLTAQDRHGIAINDTHALSIRKLTPKECWRLMGQSDEMFHRAEKVNSNAQLYKQAGNSIVVDVLEWIFIELLIPGKSSTPGTTQFETPK